MMHLNRLDPEERKWFDAIRESLSPDLLSREWRALTPPDAHPVCGHCYVATEAAYHAFARERGLVPYVARLTGGGTHWWLARPDHSEVIDLTHEQTSKPFPYAEVGTRRPFRPGAGPRRESKRALELLRRARARISVIEQPGTSVTE